VRFLRYAMLSETLNCLIANCVMSLTPILLVNGSITMDTAYWQDIWLGSHRTVTRCVTDPLHLGGHIYVGSRGLLILTLYEPKSQHVSHPSQSLLSSSGSVLSRKTHLRVITLQTCPVTQMLFLKRKMLIPKSRRTWKSSESSGVVISCAQNRMHQHHFW